MEYIKKLDINRIQDGKMEQTKDFVIVEYPLTVFVNGDEHTVLMCSPKGLKHLAIGFLASEGIIKDNTQIKGILIDEEKGHAYVDLIDELIPTRPYEILDLSGPKIIDNNLQIKWSKLLDLVSELNKCSITFKETGGVHNYALSDGNDILLFHEDVGRHNAIDKIIGESILSGLDLSDKILISSGRVSSEIAAKTIKSNIPILVSKSAPTELAVIMAKEFNLTLIGFARKGRMNIYSGQERIF